MLCGKKSDAGNGLSRVKSWEYTGNGLIRHEVIFSEQDNLIITAWDTPQPFQLRREKIPQRQARLIYKRRKQNLAKQEFDSWCREEYGSCNLRFSA